MEDLRKSAGLASLYGVTRGDSAHLQAWSISHTCSMYEALPGKEEEVCQSPMALHNLPYITMGPSYAFTQAVRLRGRVSLPLCPSGPPDLKPWLFSYNFFKNITTEEMSLWARSLSLLHWYNSGSLCGIVPSFFLLTSILLGLSSPWNWVSMLVQWASHEEGFWAMRLNPWHTLNHSGTPASPIIPLAMNRSRFIYSIYKMALFIKVNHLM